jgi:hypothetical protein
MDAWSGKIFAMGTADFCFFVRLLFSRDLEPLFPRLRKAPHAKQCGNRFETGSRVQDLFALRVSEMAPLKDRSGHRLPGLEPARCHHRRADRSRVAAATTWPCLAPFSPCRSLTAGGGSDISGLDRSSVGLAVAEVAAPAADADCATPQPLPEPAIPATG